MNEDDDGIINQVNPLFDDNAWFGSVTLEVGIQFETLESFEKAVKDCTIQEGREIKWVKNDKFRARVKCKVEECP